MLRPDGGTGLDVVLASFTDRLRGRVCGRLAEEMVVDPTSRPRAAVIEEEV